MALKEPGGRGEWRSDPEGREGLFTEAQILHLLRVEFARARRHKHPLTLALLAVDRLEERADLLGAAFRETACLHLLTLLRKALRISDLLGRHDRDQVLLVLPHADLAGGRALVDRVRGGFRQEPLTFQGRELAMTLSAGVAAAGDQELLFHDTLLERAEHALWQAQEKGGDRVEAFATFPGAP